MSIHSNRENYHYSDYNVGWICARPIEVVMARAMLDEEHYPLPTLLQDTNEYVLGSIGLHKVVITISPLGEDDAVVAHRVVSQMALTFRALKFILTVGLGNGVAPKVRLGDVVVATSVVHYDYGRSTFGRFGRTGELYHSPSAIWAAVAGLKADLSVAGWGLIDIILDHARVLDKDQLEDVLFESTCKHIRNEVEGDGYKTADEARSRSKAADKEGSSCQLCDRDRVVDRPSRGRKVHFGPIAGNILFRDGVARDQLKRDLGGEVLCAEMESAGLSKLSDALPTFVIRGICDYVDAHSNGLWQGPAAAAAAAVAKRCLRYLPSGNPEKESDQMLSKTEILSWIPSTDYSSQQAHYLEKRHPMSNNHLDSVDFQSWVENKNRILFCPGRAGCGKSVFTATVVNFLRTRFDTREAGIAYIHCRHQPQHLQSLNQLAGSVLRQLLQGLEQWPTRLYDQYEHHKAYKAAAGLTATELCEILIEVTASYQRVFILVDGLDEINELDPPGDLSLYEKFISWLLDVQARCFGNLFMTSRPEPAILNRFYHCQTLQLGIDEETIKEYLEWLLTDIRYWRSGFDTKEDLSHRIILSAEKSFLWVAVCIKYLQFSYPTYWDSRVMGSIPAPGLLGLYETIISDICGQREPAMGRLGVRILSWIFFSERNLTVQELRHAAAVVNGSSEIEQDLLGDETIVSLCKGLVRIDSNTGLVLLIHTSLRDYFEATKGRWFPGAQKYLLSTCLTYASFNSFRVGPSSTKANFKARQESNPFYGYAARFWGVHAAKIDLPDAVTIHQIVEFLKTKSLVSACSQVVFYRGDDTFAANSANQTTGIHLAARFGLTEPTYSLISDGICDVNAVDSEDISPLYLAAENGHEGVVTVLLDHGANIETRDIYGRTALIKAVLANQESVVSLLVERGANIEVTQNTGETALLLAREIGNPVIINLLKYQIETVVDSNFVDNMSDFTDVDSVFSASSAGYSQSSLGEWQPFALRASDIVAQKFCQDPDFRRFYLEALAKFGKQGFKKQNDIFLKLFFKDLRSETTESSPIHLRAIRFLRRHSEREKVAEQVFTLCHKYLESATKLQGRDFLALSRMETQFTPQDYNISTGEDNEQEEVDSRDSEGSQDENENHDEKALELDVENVLNFFIGGQPFEQFKSNLRCLVSPPKSLKMAVQTSNKRVIRNFLQRFLDSESDDLGTENEYGWTRELYGVGYSLEEITKVLFEMENDAPWIYFTPHTFGEGHDKPGKNSHLPGCVHNYLEQGGLAARFGETTSRDRTSASESDLFSSNTEFEIEEIQELCGLAGITPISRNPSSLFSTKISKEDGQLVAVISYSVFDNDMKLDGASVLEKIISTLRRVCHAASILQRCGRFCDRFTVIFRHAGLHTQEEDEIAPEIASLAPIYLELIFRILDNLEGMKIGDFEYEEKTLSLRTALDSILSLFPSQPRSTKTGETQNTLHISALVAQFLSLGFLSYNQAHMGSVQPFFLDTPLEKIVLRGCNSREEGQFYYITANLTKLTCIGDMLASKVISFELNGTLNDVPPATGVGSPGVDIMATPEDLLDTWGPGNFVIQKEPNQSICAIRVRGGYIHATKDRFHWSSTLDDEFLPIIPFAPTDSIRIGTFITVKNDCTVDEQSSRKNSSDALQSIDTHHGYWKLSEIQFGLQAGNFALLQANTTGIKTPGITMKQTILEQRAKDLVHSLDHLYGLQVSFCTGVARRVSLQEVVADMLQPFIRASLREDKQWDELSQNDIDGAFRGTNDDLKIWLNDLSDDLFDFVMNTVQKILLSLRSTGIDPGGNYLCVAWPYDKIPFEGFRIKCDDKISCWIRMLADSEDCATFAYISVTCLETQHLKCIGALRCWDSVTPILQTEVYRFNPRGKQLGSFHDNSSYFFQKLDGRLWVVVEKDSTTSHTSLLVSSKVVLTQAVNNSKQVLRRVAMLDRENNRVNNIRERQRVSEPPKEGVDVLVLAKGALIPKIANTTQVHLTSAVPPPQAQIVSTSGSIVVTSTTV
ncbi:hypothetical protein H072_7130 [Dactylellina haptotyla CBS 200.50]|uniref:Uncharacterized protein n=1 Tax=Dactylellina haptotyla (strain CBS 200.50) TaxID=1284197 RepID=S8AD98_DACHA|nr:hypothetical protein H072_7130 [Dactylellina haptotyla CBS 200.50]